MKIISLNTWGGSAGEDKVLGFFEKYNNKVDVFCLQEIWSAPYENMKEIVAGKKPLESRPIMTNGMQDISKLLSDYVPYFRPHHLENYGLLMMIHKKFSILEEGDIWVHKHKDFIPVGDVGHHARNLQYATVLDENKNPITILNFHGLWNGMGKGDSEDRLQQSKNITDFTSKLTNDCVLMGDFNLSPDTQSVKVLVDSGMRNMIAHYNVTSTRTSYYKQENRYADYAFVSKGIQVKDFKVLPDEVSDHAPLYIEI
jgi:endonuclease/exonuclease/phosphatase (EEP) superfamily protein YafD